ncbi:MAG: hypothetical protein ABIJ21_01120 [Nanoarchaeota archaeon]
MANINLEIPDILHKKLKIDAARTDRTLKELIIEALDEATRT